jgi:hypothetical protein
LRKEGLRVSKILIEGNSGLIQTEREKGENKKKRKIMKDDGYIIIYIHIL